MARAATLVQIGALRVQHPLGVVDVVSAKCFGISPDWAKRQRSLRADCGAEALYKQKRFSLAGAMGYDLDTH